MLGMRGAVGSDRTLFRDAAREIKAILDEEGVGHMPIGVDVVEPPMLFELQKAGIEIRDGQQTMLLAREIKSHDEITLRENRAAFERMTLHYRVLRDVTQRNAEIAFSMTELRSSCCCIVVRCCSA